MLTTSEVLVELSKTYIAASNQAGSEYRLIIPGLTSLIAEQLHSALRDSGINSYLVIAGSRQPDEKRRWLLPVSLTSMRIGSFAAVCDPGALSDVRDSIRGSGGTIRSYAFSEEWPWIDTGSEAFRFPSLFVAKLLDQWGVGNGDRTWFRLLLSDVLVESTRRLRDRGTLLLEDIIGGFSPSIPPELPNLRERFLFHCGLPHPGNLGLEPSRIATLIRRRLIKPIFERFRNEPDAREQVIGNVPDDDPERHEVISAVETLFDGLSSTAVADGDMLSFRECWGKGVRSIRNWQILTFERLCMLFEVQEQPPVGLIVSLQEMPGALISDDGLTAALSASQAISLKVEYDLPLEDFTTCTCHMQVLVRTRVIVDKILTEASGSFTQHVQSLEELNLSYRSRVPVRVTILNQGAIRAEARVHLHCCGEKREAFVVTTPYFLVDNAHNVSSDDPGPEQRHTVDAPVKLHIFSVTKEQPSLSCEEESEQLVNNIGFWSTAETVDVFAQGGGQLSCRCDAGDYWASITYEAKDIEGGEFTLEDELRSSIVNCSLDRVREILSIHAGISRTPYSRLGQLTDRARELFRLSACFENRHGWQPVLLDLNGRSKGTIRACGDFSRTLGDIQNVEAIATTTLPKRSIELLQQYSTDRDALRETILASLDIGSRPSERPEYALYPIYIGPDAFSSGALETNITRFLQAYRSILAYLDEHAAHLSWEQAFILTHLDCAVHWGSDASKNNVFLLGPWHPLVTAKRFMVQRSLVLRGQRLTERRDKRFSRLANLLAGTPGFNWHPCLKAEDVAFEAAHVVPTSDPGWHFGFKRRAADDEGMLSHVCELLSDQFGIKPSLSMPSSGAMVGNVLGSFLRTFPSKRHVGIFFQHGFQGLQEVSSVDHLLHHDDDPTASGHQLPGGVALCFQANPELPLNTTWSNPSLQVFHYSEWRECLSEQYPDIRFCPPVSKLQFLETPSAARLPRGDGAEAVFLHLLSRCIQGQAFLPQSVSEGWDSQVDKTGEIGEVFSSACGMACLVAGQKFGLVESIALPERLESSWTVVPGAVLDPAVFVRYVKDGRERNIEERALWDYHISLSSGTASFFVLSTIPLSYRSAVNGVFSKSHDHASEFVSELGQVGLAIAGEAMKSGRHALGTIGLVGAVRLFNGYGEYVGPLKWEQNHIGFLLPVDSFEEMFEDKTDGARGEAATSRRRADLLAVSLHFPADDTLPLTIQAVAVECKFSSSTFPDAAVHSALGQAIVTTEWFKSLCELAKPNSGMPERLALLRMVWFGTRICGDDVEIRTEIERRLYKSILSGRFRYKAAKHPAVLITTEAGLLGPAEMSFSQSGAWIRLNRNNWPGICETPSIGAVRRTITDLFDVSIVNFTQHLVDEPAFESGDPKNLSQQFAKATQTSFSFITNQQTITEKDKDVSESKEMVGMTPSSESENSDVQSSGKDREGLAETAPLHALGISVRRLLVGMDSSRREVYFDPHSPLDRLDNFNTMITGSSGKGKTQLLKYLLTALRSQGANVLVLDFKNDFASDTHFVELADIVPVLIAFDGMPFNPLIPYPITDPRSGQPFLQSAQHITGVASVFRRTYGLGPQQEAAVKNAIRQAFSEAGVDPTSTIPYDPNLIFPDLARVGEILEQNNVSAYNRLDPLFTLGIFKEQFWRTSFSHMVTRSAALDLSQIPSDPLKNALAELIVLSAHSYFNSQPHCGSLRQVFAVDEAHRILRADFLERFALECRAYGISLLLSSQYPSHFPPEISACMATKIIHGNDRDVDRVREIANLLGSSGREAEIAELGMFEAIFSNKHFTNVLIRTITYPIDLVFSALKANESGELSREEISSIPGLDVGKLSVGNLVRHLERLGIGEGTNGTVRLIARDL